MTTCDSALHLVVTHILSVDIEPLCDHAPACPLPPKFSLQVFHNLQGHTLCTSMANSKYEYVKTFEQSTTLLPNTYMVVRIDGRGFHKWVPRYLLDICLVCNSYSQTFIKIPIRKTQRSQCSGVDECRSNGGDERLTGH